MWINFCIIWTILMVLWFFSDDGLALLLAPILWVTVPFGLILLGKMFTALLA